MNGMTLGSRNRRRRPGVVGGPRSGGAAVELAVLSPIFLLIFVLVLDFGRVFYYSQVIQNAATAGALYLSDPSAPSRQLYGSVTAAATADAGNLSPAPNVSSSSGTDAGGNGYVRCTVTWTFNMISVLPGVPTTKSLSRTVQMRSVPP